MSRGERLLRFCLIAVLIGLALFASRASAAAEKRVALVIGNGDYKSAPRLDNPVSDAKAIATLLAGLGFQVTEGYDQSVDQMRTKLSKFTESLVGSDVAIVYFAGHGVSVDDENYLLPTDIVLKTPTDLDLNAIDVTLILRQMRREERVNILILDACRNNPFAEELARVKTRAIVSERGLAPIEGNVTRGSLIAFATDPKSAALDGPGGEHSPFTRALLDHLADADVSIETVMSRVRAEVWESTKNAQLPWINSSLIGEFDLNRKSSSPPDSTAPVTAALPPVTPSTPADHQATENLFWESVQHSGLIGDYQAYLEAFPNGVFSHMARNRIAALTPAAEGTPPNLHRPPAPTANSGEVTLASEIGTEETEKRLDLTVAARTDLQRRLIVLKLDAGPPDGELGKKSRIAIRMWQVRHKMTPSGFLGPLQYATLRSESEGALLRLVVISRHEHRTERLEGQPRIISPNSRTRPIVPAPLDARPVRNPERPSEKETPEPESTKREDGHSSFVCAPGYIGIRRSDYPLKVDYKCVPSP